MRPVSAIQNFSGRMSWTTASTWDRRDQALSVLKSIALIVLVILSGHLAAPQTIAQENANRVLIFISDGMRRDFMRRFVTEGKMPAFERLIELGIDSGKGMIPPVPPNSGVSWTTLATGASPSISGVTGNTFHDNTQPFTLSGISAWSPGANQSQTIAEAAEKAGLKVAVLGWQTFDRSTIKSGIVVEPSPQWLTTRGVVANYDVPLSYTDIRDPLGRYLTLDQVSLADANGWLRSPQSWSPAREAAFSMSCLVCGTPGTIDFNVFIFDSTNDGQTNYDQVLVSPSKDGAQEVSEARCRTVVRKYPDSGPTEPVAGDPGRRRILHKNH